MEIYTVEQYARLRKISVQAVYNQIYAGRDLKGAKYQKHGKGYIITGDREKIISK